MDSLKANINKIIINIFKNLNIFINRFKIIMKNYIIISAQAQSTSSGLQDCDTCSYSNSIYHHVLNINYFNIQEKDVLITSLDQKNKPLNKVVEEFQNAVNNMIEEQEFNSENLVQSIEKLPMEKSNQEELILNSAEKILESEQAIKQVFSHPISQDILGSQGYIWEFLRILLSILLKVKNSLIIFYSDIICLFPEIFLSLGILFLLCFGLILENYTFKNFRNFKMYKILTNMAILILILDIILIINNKLTNNIILNYQLINNDLTDFAKILISISTIIILLLSISYLEKEKIFLFEFPIFILMAVLAMFLIRSSNDFISLYLSIEFQSLCFYILASLKRNSYFSTESGLKYFVLGAFSSGLLLFGFSLLYGFTGIMTFSDFIIFLKNEDNFIIIISLIFLISGLFFKLSIAPFHMWTPDVYQGAPTIITAFFAIVSKIPLIILLLRFKIIFFLEFFSNWHNILIFGCLLSLIFGTIGGLYQVKLKRLLAYSSITNLGYMLLALIIGTIEGLDALFIYLIIYILININIFGIFLNLRERSKNRPVRSVIDLFNISKSNLSLTFSLCLALFSLAGIPPLAGFYGKFYLFFASLYAHYYFLTLIIIILSVFASIYYIRLIKIMLFDNINTWGFYYDLSKTEAYIISITTLFNIYFFLFPSPLFLLIHNKILHFIL